MSIPKPIAALAAGSCILVSVAALAQSSGTAAQRDNPAVQVLVLADEANVNWIEKSSVAALREGVIEKMELQVGMPVKAGGLIGTLHRKFAEYGMRKAELQAKAIAPKEKAMAQEEVAASVCARNKRLNEHRPGMVSAEDVAKAEGELKVATAMIHEAEENQEIAKAEYAVAKQIYDEHTILAPFDGIITRRMKNPGESVRAGDAVVELGNLNKLCADAYVPLEYAYRVKEDQIVEIQPVLTRAGSEPLAIESKKFRGKITFVDPEIQAVAETAVHIRAEFDNPPPWELKPGLKVKMTIFLTPAAAANAPPSGPTRTARTQ
jgi:RND family efflux transporter MFP subunit